MDLIERYLHKVGRYLPGKNRADILAELRSHLSDTLDERVQGEPGEEDVVALLKETGSPRKIAASYPGTRQYLIGPELYPFFRMVAGIVLAAVLGAQLLAFGVNYWLGEEVLSIWESLASIITSIPAALGTVVIVFLILQHFGVNPKLDDEEWDPRSLPQLEEDEQVKKGERIFGIIFGSLVLALLAAFPDKIGIYIFPGGTFYPNPVIAQNIGLIVLSLLASISLGYLPALAGALDPRQPHCPRGGQPGLDHGSGGAGARAYRMADGSWLEWIFQHNREPVSSHA